MSISPQTIQDPALLTQLQAVKGRGEVVVTAVVIRGLTAWSQSAIDARNERLSALHAERNLLHRVFRHNLRQDLCIIRGYSDLIDADVSAEELDKFCEKILERAGTIESYLEKIIDIEKILEPSSQIVKVDLVELVREDERGNI